MYQQIKTYLFNNKMTAAMFIIALTAVSSAAWNWYHPQIQKINQTEYQTVEKEKIVEKIKTVRVSGPKEIVTIEKQVIVDRLKLPPEVANNPAKVITGNADIEPSEGGTSVISVLDTNTGETTLIAKEKPVDLFGFPSDIEAGVRYGVSTSSVIQEGNVFARWKFLRVGKAYLGAYGEIATKPEAKAMIEASFKF